MSTPEPSPSNSPVSSIPPPPGYQPSTGNLPIDVYNSIRNISQVPCARNSLLSGIASGVGIGVIRGLSAGPLVAGHWAMATFTLISLGSWHLCQRQIHREQETVQRIIESIPQRTLKATEKGTPAINRPTSN